jgi:predicted O-linked N-acetylglucosamine transferase (SPINDLY family)
MLLRLFRHLTSQLSGKAERNRTHAPAPSIEGLRKQADAFVRAQQWDAAADALSELVSRGVEDAWPYATLGSLAHRAGDGERAVELYYAALERDPFQKAAIFNLPKLLMERCDWTGVRALRERLDRLRGRGTEWRDFVSPFNAVILPLSRGEQAQVSGFHARRIQASVNGETVVRGQRGSRDRIRVGYLSGDFHDHATAHLTAGMYGLHDRGRFEVFAYSIGPDVEDPYRARVREGCDEFVDLSRMSDHEAARRIGNDAIDVLVDLKGYTQGDRPRILAYRPAPTQVHYLGYPGPLAAPFIDYAICDAVVVPPSHESDYPEALVRLEPCYQVNDGSQPPVLGETSRSEHGLPEGATVLCSFSQNYKIEPVVFEAWMRVLRELPGSVLWLLCGNRTAQAAIQREAQNRGVAPQRIVFADFRPRQQHLERIALADLALDTYFYNGHTTCSDTLWAGVPIVTCPGDAFAARVGASVVSAAGLPELVTTDLDRYATLAIELCREPGRVAALRRKLQQTRSTCALFDTPRTTRQLERAYEQMFERNLAGLPPSSFNSFV